MKLLVIVLCVLSERYLVHSLSYHRFGWFNGLLGWLTKHIPLTDNKLINAYGILAIIIIPTILIAWVILALLGHFVYGFIGFILNLLVFYYCFGPENPFYPVNSSSDELGAEIVAGNYFYQVNQQMFAVIFWFIIGGPLAIIAYRLFCLAEQHETTRMAATQITDVLDWITVRITAILYLLVGNFQQGFSYYSKMFFSSPENNKVLLSTDGLLAARSGVEETVTLPDAQSLVEHALIVFMVFLALFTLVSWL